MPKWAAAAKRAATVATGVAIAASVGLGGAEDGSAAAPALKIKAGAIWTLKEHAPGGCEQVVFASNGTFSAANGDAGQWVGGKSTITMLWTTGVDAGVSCGGSYISSQNIYKGTVTAGGISIGGKLVHKTVSGC